MRPAPFLPAFVLAVLALAGSAAAADGIDPAFRTDILTLLDVTGTAKTAHQAASMASRAALDGQKQASPQVPARVWDIAQEVLEEEFAFAFAPEGPILEKVVPIYAEKFTHAEIRELLAFYASPIGKKINALMPELMAEGGRIGQEWAESNGARMQQRVADRLRKEGFGDGAVKP